MGRVVVQDIQLALKLLNTPVKSSLETGGISCIVGSIDDLRFNVDLGFLDFVCDSQKAAFRTREKRNVPSQSCEP